MKCRICDRECPPGANLCRDCAAARKRAFAATVTQPLLAAAGAPSVGHPRFAPRPAKARSLRKPVATASARSAAAMAASAADRVTPPRRLAVQWLWLGVALALVAVYVLIRILAANPGASSVDAAPPTDGANAVATPASVAPSTPLAPRLPAATGAAALTRPPGVETSATGAMPAKSGATKSRSRKAAAKVEIPAVAEVPPTPAPEPAPEPPKPAPQAAVPRDPWQPMNEGLTRCARLDWVDRATCEQKLRMQYCANYWGLVMQCPIGPTDHGR